MSRDTESMPRVPVFYLRIRARSIVNSIRVGRFTSRFTSPCDHSPPDDKELTSDQAGDSTRSFASGASDGIPSLSHIIDCHMMNYPYPQNGYGAMPNANPYAYYPYAYPYPYPPGTQHYHQTTEGSSTANFLASRWNVGLSPSLVILVIIAGVIGWWQFGRAFINGDSSN